MNERCETCKFFRRHQNGRDHYAWGSCHRYPPVLVGEPMGGVRIEFPQISDQEWCGEYKSSSEPSIPLNGRERNPLSAWKLRIVTFLKEKQLATRQQIVAGTGVPVGSLSSLLRDKTFKSISHGMWGLRADL
jgi:hypothetical protein